MAYATHNTNASQGFDAYGFSGILLYLRNNLAKRRIYSRTLRELQELNDRDLADLGIHRSEVPRIAREAAYGA